MRALPETEDTEKNSEGRNKPCPECGFVRYRPEAEYHDFGCSRSQRKMNTQPSSGEQEDQSEMKTKNPSSVTIKSPIPALQTWRWRIGIAAVAFSAVWLVSGAILMWLLVWKPLAIGHTLLWTWILVSCSETMRRFYFRAIGG